LGGAINLGTKTVPPGKTKQRLNRVTAASEKIRRKDKGGKKTGQGERGKSQGNLGPTFILSFAFVLPVQRTKSLGKGGGGQETTPVKNQSTTFQYHERGMQTLEIDLARTAIRKRPGW